jgi:hypothetical protein
MMLADLTLIKQQKQPGRSRRRGRPFTKGQSGNPAGRPRGCRDKGNRAAEAYLDNQSEALLQRAVELALAGDASHMRLCVERIVAPRRERSVEFTMPRMQTAADLAAAMGAVAEAAARGELTPGEAVAFCRIAEAMAEAIDTTDFDRRLTAVENTPPSAR